MTDLLPCPFCGSNNLRYEFCGSQGYIECNECGTQGPCDERAADPICDLDAACDAWNRRAALAQPEPQGPDLTACDLLERFIDCFWDEQDAESYPNAAALVAQARALLVQPVPQGPTDEAWEWYSYCPEDGIALHLNKESAQKAAQEIMGSYAKAAHSDGWHEDMESVSWGMLLPVEQAQVVERTEAEPDSEFDEWIRYGLVPSRWGRPATTGEQR